MPPSKRVLGALDDLCGSESDASSEDEAQPSAKVAKPGASAASKISVQDLERAGYTSGPSVLYVPEQKSAEDHGAYEWSSGKERRTDHDAEPTREERLHMRAATTQGVQDDAQYASKLLEHTEKMRNEKRQEKEQRAKKGQLSWKEKEKRKRDQGKQSSAKNFIEEEKRRAREAGCYAGQGFDS